MSVLELSGRPYTVFDPANKQHRRYYSEFVKTVSWGTCPVRFLVPDDHGDIITMIQRSLVKYYVEREFPNVVKKQRMRTKKKPLQQ
jgi:hypothetical protein